MWRKNYVLNYFSHLHGNRENFFAKSSSGKMLFFDVIIQLHRVAIMVEYISEGPVSFFFEQTGFWDCILVPLFSRKLRLMLSL